MATTIIRVGGAAPPVACTQASTETSPNVFRDTERKYAPETQKGARGVCGGVFSWGAKALNFESCV